MKIFHLIADQQDMGLVCTHGNDLIYIGTANFGITRSVITIKKLGWKLFPVASYENEGF